MNFWKYETDCFFKDSKTEYNLCGLIKETNDFVLENQLLKPELWARFVDQFRNNADGDNGWRGEFWGKMMRGACFVYSVTRSKELYTQIEKTVCEMMSLQKQDGRISSYPKENEFCGWDIWCRKYVMLGMEYFLEICQSEELSKRVLNSICLQADDIMWKIGSSADGKKEITAATNHWRGLNSSSLLEPIVKLYILTNKKEYFDFAEYIVNSGGTDVFNIFEAAYQNKLFPYQYPVTKAYEMMSCFEGLLDFYRVTKTEKYKTSVVNFTDKLLQSDFTVIGCCGCTHELFDHSTVRQANTTNGYIMQETCVTVTVMKLLYQLNLLTGDSKYADAFEKSAYNAFLGALNTEKNCNHTSETENLVDEPLPFDSYSPLTAGERGRKIGGFRVMADGHYYGCCACIGSAGNGLIPQMSLLCKKDGFVFNLWLNGSITAVTPRGENAVFETQTEYPKYGTAKVKINLKKAEEFEILIRNPEWSDNTTVTVNGQNTAVNKGYIKILRTWQNGDEIKVCFDMKVKPVYPIPYGSQVLNNEVVWGHNYIIPTFDEEDVKAKNHIALQYGPIILAQDNRLGYSVDEPVEIETDGQDTVKASVNENVGFPHILALDIRLKNGEKMTTLDYASAGKLWNEKSKMAAWILTK